MKRAPAQAAFADQLEAYLSSAKPAPAGPAAKSSGSHHWMAFTSVAGSALALASSADAAVHHVVPPLGTEPKVLAPGNAVDVLEVNLDGVGPADIRLRGIGSSFRFTTTTGGSTYTTTYGATTRGPVSTYTLSSGAYRRLGIEAINGANLEPESSGLLKRLSDGDPIPGGGTHVPGTLMAAGELTYSGTFATGAGQFLPPGNQTTGFAAFSLPGGEFGWIRLRISRAGSLLDSLTLLEWAWADVGEAIRAGQTEADGPQAVPEPATWIAGLAMGAAGIQAYRNRRKAEAAASGPTA